MKKLKQIIAAVRSADQNNHEEYNDLLWQLICYPPKMAPRLQQENLLAEAVKFSLKVNDTYFAKKELTFNGFIWGSGKRRILLTHGWGSKAADLSEIIIALREIDDVQVIAFDAPGNGSSEGELSNLLLFVQAVKAIIAEYGKPHVLIGHSLGAMANVMATEQLGIAPTLSVSLTPLIRLKENFEASMTAAEVSRQAQEVFLQRFEAKFGTPASYYNLPDLYSPASPFKHFLAYDENDMISPYAYISEFLAKNPTIITKNYPGAGHDKIIRSPEMIGDLVSAVNTALIS